MNTQKKFLKVLSMLTIILLIATIFIPGNGNRNAVASIGILGILLLFLSTLLPKIYKLTLNLLKNQGKTSPWSSLKSSEPVSETEELLWRQISYQITDKLQAAFPNATWEFQKPPSMKQLLCGNPIRLRTFHTEDYAGSGYENAANDLARILNDVATEKAQNDYEQELTEDLQKSADEIHYGNAHAGIHVTIHRINPVSDFFIKSYQTVASPLLRTSKRLQSSILPLLKEEAEGGKQKNLLFGKRLDMRALHRKDGGIFTRTRLPDEEQKLSVGLLVDESGSMGWGDRITHARKTAIVLYDFCMSLGIPITIYGHSTDSKGVALYSYAEFDSLDASDRYRLMDMSARNGNRDGAALRYVAEHLAKRPESQKLLIIISDGQPADCGYSGTEAEADLRGIKNEYRKRGIVIFAAAIGDDKENIRRIYQDGFLDITKLEDLPKNMTQLVKQYLK